MTQLIYFALGMGLAAMFSLALQWLVGPIRQPRMICNRLCGHTWTDWYVDKETRTRHPKCFVCGEVRGVECNHDWVHDDFVWREECQRCGSQHVTTT